MSLLVALGAFALGVGVVIGSAERLVESTVGLSRQVGLSAFLISVLFIGFDPENLGVGAVASGEQAAGIALGTIVGAAMVALALAFGLTAVAVPLSFDRVPLRILLLPVGAVTLLVGLALDGGLSRLDGAVLLAGYGTAVGLLVHWERKGLRILPSETIEDAEEDASSSLVWALGWFVASLVGGVVGSELLLWGARPLIERLGWTDTTFGMTLLALLVSIEEVARELPAALRGRPDVSYGNVVGSALAFFCFNAGVIALVRPVPVAVVTRTFYLPACAATVLLLTGLMASGRVPRWGGMVLLLAYGGFALGPLWF